MSSIVTQAFWMTQISMTSLLSRHSETAMPKDLLQHRQKLLEDLRVAMRSPQQLRLVYQPRVDFRTNRCVGAEALIRWRHPVLGALSPAAFIPLIEDDPAILALTDWVLDRAMAFIATLKKSEHHLRVSVNISPANLTAGWFVGRLVEMLGRHAIDPSRLELEFTESVLINDSARTRQQLEQIRRMGLKISIDDFGAGYSNLKYLKQIPADFIKIDRELIDMIGGEQDGETVVQWIIGLAEKLRFQIVAEGVDSDQKAATLTRWGCHEGQGFGIAAPMPEAKLAGWVRRYNTPADGSIVRLQVPRSDHAEIVPKPIRAGTVIPFLAKS